MLIRVLGSAAVAGGVAGVATTFLFAPTAVAIGLGAGTLTSEMIRAQQSGQAVAWAGVIVQSLLAAAVAFVVVSWLRSGP